MPRTILIVDDEVDILHLMRYNIEREGFVVHTARDGAEALESASADPPDLIVLDIMMPVIDGYEVCRRLRATPEHKTTPIMFLTARAGEFDEVLGLELGADDYIEKPVSPRVLVARIRSMLRRSEGVRTETLVMPELLRVGELEINRQNYTVRIAGAETFFPKKEFELLALLASNPGRLFSRDELLNKVWGESVHVVDRTVDVHISKVRDKLGKHARHIETVKGVGYRFRT